MPFKRIFAVSVKELLLFLWELTHELKIDEGCKKLKTASSTSPMKVLENTRTRPYTIQINWRILIERWSAAYVGQLKLYQLKITKNSYAFPKARTRISNTLRHVYQLTESLQQVLRDSDTSLRMDKNDSSRKIISFCPHRSIFLGLFDEIFMFYLWKSMLWQFLIWELLCRWWVTTADHSLVSVLYLYDSFFCRYVTPQMKNLGVMLLAGWFPQLIFNILRS